MNHKNQMFCIVFLVIVGLLLYYSPVTFYGYWPDALFSLFSSFFSLYSIRHISKNSLTIIIKLVCYVNLIVIIFNSVSIWNGILPVRLIPKGHFEDKNEYAYFLDRGNTGLTSGCFGEVQYQKQISWLPFIELRIETDKCSSIDYESYIHGS